MTGRVDRMRTRAPDATRQKLLLAAFTEFHLRGFQAASLDTILARAGVTKGALYHHFPDKAALGYAVLEEVVRVPLLEAYIGPLREAEGDPLAALQDALRRRAEDFVQGGIELGCPLNNLSQEMSPLDEEFRARAANIFQEWIDAFAEALALAQERGYVRSDADTRPIAAFIVSSVEGSFGLAKNAMSVDMLRSNLAVLADFLDTLRPPP